VAPNLLATVSTYKLTELPNIFRFRFIDDEHKGAVLDDIRNLLFFLLLERIDTGGSKRCGEEGGENGLTYGVGDGGETTKNAVG